MSVHSFSLHYIPYLVLSAIRVVRPICQFSAIHLDDFKARCYHFYPVRCPVPIAYCSNLIFSKPTLFAFLPVSSQFKIFRLIVACDVSDATNSSKRPTYYCYTPARIEQSKEPDGSGSNIRLSYELLIHQLSSITSIAAARLRRRWQPQLALSGYPAHLPAQRSTAQSTDLLLRLTR